MNYERRLKYQNQKSNSTVINMAIDPYILELMCKFLVTDSNHIKRGALVNIQKLIYGINPDLYNGDPDNLTKVRFIKKGLEARLDYNLSDPILIMKHIDGGIVDDSIVDMSNFSGLNSSEIQWLNNMVSESLKLFVIYEKVDEMSDLCARIKAAEFGSKSALVSEFETLNSEIQNLFRKSKNESIDEAIFSLRDGIFQNSIYDIHRDLNSPRNILKTGMRGLNDLLGGGFQNTRVYVLFGLPGEGKSAMLLNIAYQLKKYNRFYKTKDPTKRPCIVLLTMENKVDESVNRLFDIATSLGSLKDYDPDQSINILRTQGELYLSDDSPIDIFIKYKATNSVDTSYLYTLTEDLEDDGYEVICLIQDYIGRIRSTMHSDDLRIEYGAVVDEMKAFATAKDIPVLTASQLNRDASKHIDEGRKSNKSDLVRMIGRSNVSESLLILNNCDGGFILAPEWTTDGKKYMGIQRIKKRFTVLEKRDYVYLPFKDNNEISLVEDEDLAQPLFKVSLMDDMHNGMKQNPYRTNKIVELGQVINNDSSPNIFKQSSIADLSSVAAFQTNIPKQNLIQPFYFEGDLMEPLEFF